MQVNFERAVKTLIERWDEMTDGRKPIFVRIIAYWPGVSRILDLCIPGKVMEKCLKK